MMEAQTQEIIRLAGEADVARVIEMGRRFLNEGPYKDQIGDVPEVPTRLLAFLVTTDKCKVLVSEENGELTGVVAFIISPHYFSGETIACEMIWYVEPEHRKGGVAMRLFWEAEKLAKSMGAKRMQFTAPTDAVARVYARFGYKQIEVTFQKELS